MRKALATADEELARLVAAEPSPGLQARIRSAASLAPEPVMASAARWLWPAAAVAVAALVLAVALIARRSPSHEPALAALTRLQQPTSPRLMPEPSPPPVRQAAANDLARGLAALQHPGPTALSAARSEPEVLVPPGEGEALLRFVALVQRDRLAPIVLGSVGQPSTGLTELQPIDIKPLEIVPLDPAESSGT